MEIRYEKHWSGWLNRDMEFKIYGSCGKPVIFIPCQAGRFWDFESFRMVDYWAPWIESGKCMVFSIDTIDNESWAAIGADNRWRIENHEKWYHYVVDELVPYIRHVAGMANGHDQGIMTFGASMGAMHASISSNWRSFGYSWKMTAAISGSRRPNRPFNTAPVRFGVISVSFSII